MNKQTNPCGTEEGSTWGRWASPFQTQRQSNPLPPVLMEPSTVIRVINVSDWLQNLSGLTQ